MMMLLVVSSDILEAETFYFHKKKVKYYWWPEKAEKYFVDIKLHRNNYNSDEYMLMESIGKDVVNGHVLSILPNLTSEKYYYE